MEGSILQNSEQPKPPRISIWLSTFKCTMLNISYVHAMEMRKRNDKVVLKRLGTQCILACISWISDSSSSRPTKIRVLLQLFLVRQPRPLSYEEQACAFDCALVQFESQTWNRLGWIADLIGMLWWTLAMKRRMQCIIFVTVFRDSLPKCEQSARFTVTI